MTGDMIEAVETWIWKRMEGIYKMSNENVLEKIKERRILLCMIKRRKGIWIGLVLRKSGLLAVVLEGTVEGETYRGRR